MIPVFDQPIPALIHDLRQPLSVIESCACCVRMMLPYPDPRILEQLDCIEKQVLEASLILHTAGAFARPPGQTGGGADPESLARTKAESAAVA